MSSSLKKRIDALQLSIIPKKTIASTLSDVFEHGLLNYLFDPEIPEPPLPGETIAMYRRRKGESEARRAEDYGWTSGDKPRMRIITLRP